MEKWEYITRFVWAHNEGWKAKESIEFYNKEYGTDHPPIKPKKFSPQFMIGILNNMGEQGWELIHMEPVAGVGDNEDVKFTGDVYTYSNVYFCVFKRRKA